MWPLLRKRVVGLLLSFSFFILITSSVHAADSDIVINEFQVEPSGSAQWVELYNKGDSDVDLFNWLLSDNANHALTIPQTILSPRQCVSFTSGSFHFNTASSDGVNLKKDSTVIDSFNYDKSPGSGISYGRESDGDGSWKAFSTPTKDRLNTTGSICSVPSPTPTLTPTSTPINEPTPTRTPTPTKSPTPTKTPSPTPSKTVPPTSSTTKTTVTPSKKPVAKEVMPTNHPTSILGTSDSVVTPTVVKKQSVLVKSSTDSQINPLTLMLCGIGTVLLVSCGILGVHNYRKNKLK